MSLLTEAVRDFLAQRRIAVVGVSRTKQDAANVIYRKLRDSGHEVFAINPNAETVEGNRCFPSLTSVDEQLDGVVVVTRPAVTEQIVRECAALNITRIWMHRSFGNSVSEQAVRFCHEHHIKVIPGACPMMFCEPVDFAHKCLRRFFGVMGKMPKITADRHAIQ